MLTHIAVVWFSVLFVGGCSNSSTGFLTDNASVIEAPKLLTITPLAKTIGLDQPLDLTVAGGMEPYSFSILFGNGSLDAFQTSCVFHAPHAEGSTIIRVQDSAGNMGYANVEISDQPVIQPQSKILAVHNQFPFAVLSGKAPYHFSIEAGEGTIDALTGAFVAGAHPGPVVIRVTDAGGRSTQTDVTINPPLNFLTINPYVEKSTQQNITATGGVPPYLYEVISGGGSLDATTGTFHSPPAIGITAVKVTDGVGNVNVALLNITDELSINPPSLLLGKNTHFSFSALGGVPPYSYTLEPGGIGTVSAMTGQYSAPGAAGTSSVRVTDSKGQSRVATIKITESLFFSAASFSLAVGNSFDVSSLVSGGLSPLTYTVPLSQGAFTGSIYVAPNVPGVYTISVYDSQSPVPNSVTALAMVSPALSLLPTSAKIPISGTRYFSALGGVPPYSYSVVGGGGTIVSTSGLYTAPTFQGNAMIQVTDARNNTATALIDIQNPLSLTPSSKTLLANESFTFTASGGVSPYTFSVLSGGGVIHSSTGVYTAPGSSSIVWLRVEDANGDHQDALVTILNPLTISPMSVALIKNGSITFMAAGGLAPYSFSLVSGGGGVDQISGVYTAPMVPGTATIRVTDSSGGIKDAAITIYDGLSISPFTKTIPVHQTFTFTASGGVPPYQYALVSGVGSISTSGSYSSGSTGTALVRVTDGAGNESDATIAVTAALAINPASKTLSVHNATSFSAVGGVPPYFFSIVSGLGEISSSSGDFQAAGTSGSTVVRVTDSVDATADATVTVNDSLVLTPGTGTVLAGGTQDFMATGGVGPYLYTVVSGGGSFAVAQFTAPVIASGASIVVQVTDSLGNTAQATLLVEPILVAITTPNSSGSITDINKNSFTISGTCSENGRPIALTATDGPHTVTATPNCSVGTWSSVLNLGGLNDTSVTITAHHSNVHNVSATPASVTVSKDGTPPTLSILAPVENAFVSTLINVTGSCSEAGRPVSLSTDGGLTTAAISTCTAGSYNSSLNLSGISDGAVTITGTHGDAAGNTAIPAVVHVQKDSVAPVISAFAVTNSSPTNSATYNLTFTATGTPTEYCLLENSTVVAGCAWLATPLPTSYIVTSSNNAKVLSAWVRDAAGNVSVRSDSNSVTLNTDVPLAPTALALSNPSASPAKIPTPELLVSGVSVGDTVGIYTDSFCLIGNLKGTQVVSAGTTVAITSSTLSEGAYTFFAKRTNAAGTASNCSTASVAYQLDLTTPTITGVTSSTANGTYGVGGLISIQIGFSENMVVTGVPLLNLTTGRSGAAATYVAGSGTNTLTFSFTVASGDNSSDLDYSNTSALDVSTSTLSDLAGNILSSPVLAVPGAAGSLGANKNLVLNTTPSAAPTSIILVTPTSSPSTQQTPTVSVAGVSNGDNVKLFTNSNCTTQVASGSATGASVSLTTTSLTEGSYTFYANRTDAVGNVSSCSTASLSYVVDRTTPAITNLTSSTPNGTYKAAGSISIQMEFSEIVIVTGTPELSLSTGRAGAKATYSSGSGSNTLTFNYTVTSGDNTSDLDYNSTAALSLAGGSILDAAGNALLIPLLPAPAGAGSLGANKNIVLDTTAPSVPSGLSLSNPVSSPGTNTTPTIQVSGLVNGDTVKLFTDSGCSTQVSTGTATGTTLLLTSSALTSGTYSFYANSTDPVGNSSSCSTATVTYQIDLTNPTVLGVTASGNGPFKAGAALTISIQFSKAVFVTGTPVLALSTTRGGAQAVYTSGTSSDTLVFGYTVVSPDTSSDLTYTATSSLTLEGGTILDSAGNSATLNLPSIGGAGSLSANQNMVLDTTAPTDPSSLVDGVWMNSTSSSGTITFAASTDAGGSGILKYQLRVVRSSDSVEMKAYGDFTSGSLVSGLTLSEGVSHKVQIKAVDHAGNESAAVFSDGWTVDVTLPSTPASVDDGTTSALDSSPALSWAASTDGGSGLSFYEVAIGTTAGGTQVQNWTSVGNVLTTTVTGLNLSDGTTYYASVRAVDAAGNGSLVGQGNGWMAVNPADPHFNFISLLLQGTGINASQNNVFLDSSASNLTVTKNGNPTQGAFSPFSPSGWSASFNGTSNVYVSTAESVFYDVVAVNSTFTIEGWVKPNAAVDNPIVNCIEFTGAWYGGWHLRVNQSGLVGLHGYYASGNSQPQSFQATSNPLTVGKWAHIAAVGNAGVVKIYVNGVESGGSGTISANWLTPGDPAYLTIGGDYWTKAQANISNIRILKGIALYTANFTPPTATLTALTNTKLLTLQDPQFKDNSTVGTFLFAATGTPAIQANSPFAPTAIYSPASHGGSAYFDGSGDYLTLPNSTALDLSASLFTVRFWIYPTTSGTTRRILEYQNGMASNVDYSYLVVINNLNQIRAATFDGVNSYYITGGTVIPNTWNYVVVTRNGTTGNIYVNGSGVSGTFSASMNNPAGSVLYVGSEMNGTEQFSGYLADLQILKGAATAPSSTNPVAPIDPTGTTLNLTFSNAGIIDAHAGINLDTVGNAQVSSGTVKFLKSVYFDGSSYIEVPASKEFLLAGDFTIELWAYFNSLFPSPATDDGWAGGTLFSISNNGNASTIEDYFSLYLSNPSRWATPNAFGVGYWNGTSGSAGNQALVTTGIAPEINTWYHIAVVRSGTTLTVYINGIARASTTTALTFGSSSYKLTIGEKEYTTTRKMMGFIEDLRITKGVARYTSGFTPPIAPYPSK